MQKEHKDLALRSQSPSTKLMNHVSSYLHNAGLTKSWRRLVTLSPQYLLMKHDAPERAEIRS